MVTGYQRHSGYSAGTERRDEIVYDISGDTDYLCVEIEGRLESMSKTEPQGKQKSILLEPLCGDIPADLAEIGTSWITLVRKQDGYPTGMVLIRISPEQDNGNGGSTFKADIIASLSFPQQDGAYQDISDEDLKELEATYKIEQTEGSIPRSFIVIHQIQNYELIQ